MKDEIQSSQGSAADADILEQGDWIIIQSKKFQRPFFFNIRNESGQFRIPPELIDTIQTIGVPSSVGGSDITPNPDKPTSTQSIRKSTRNSAPAKLEVEHVLGDDSSGEDSSYTPSSSSKGVKRSRSGRSLRSRDLEIKTQHQLAQANLTNLTQNEKYIEIHEVEDNDDLDGEVNNYVACHQCTYHNPPGSIRCEICTTKLQSTPNSSMVI